MCKKKKQDQQEPKEKKKAVGGFLGFLAFLVTVACAVIYIVVMILQFVGKSTSPVVDALQYVAAVLSLIVVGIVGWRFVGGSAKWLKFIYILLIIIVAVCLIACVTWLFK